MGLWCIDDNLRSCIRVLRTSWPSWIQDLRVDVITYQAKSTPTSLHHCAGHFAFLRLRKGGERQRHSEVHTTGIVVQG